MDRIAFVFAGQGDQFPGMGKELAVQYAEAAAAYELCDRIRPGTSSQCFEGTEQELKETINTQPCLFAMELAAASVLLERGIKPVAAAGFSLGEVIAATVSGMFDRETGFRLVCKRGELMQNAAEKYETAMAAVVKLSNEQVQDICSRFQRVYPVNFNCPGQITVAGLSAEMRVFQEAVKEAGGRAIPLKVKGAFHSPFMKEAAEAFKEVLEEVDWKQPILTLYSNQTGKAYSRDAVKLLSEQICSAVQWEQCIRNMIADGIDTFIEIGPGRTLTNMIRKIDPGVTAVTAEEVLEEMQRC